MYKVDVENINKKLGSLQVWRKGNAAFVLMLLSGFMLVVSNFSDTVDGSMITCAILFTLFFLLHYIIFPLMGKIELLEEDIKNLKAATDVKDVKHY